MPCILIAEPILQRALAIYEQNLGAEHPEVALSLNNLANLYCKQEKVRDCGTVLCASACDL